MRASVRMLRRGERRVGRVSFGREVLRCMSLFRLARAWILGDTDTSSK